MYDNTAHPSQTAKQSAPHLFRCMALRDSHIKRESVKDRDFGAKPKISTFLSLSIQKRFIDSLVVLCCAINVRTVRTRIVYSMISFYPLAGYGLAVV